METAISSGVPATFSFFVNLYQTRSFWFDKNICLPYAKGIPCIVCEEHCPTPQKAIRFRQADVLDDQGRQVRVKQPYVVDSLCIGCGICETKCPVPGRSAIYITSAGEDRDVDSILPVSGETGGEANIY